MQHGASGVPQPFQYSSSCVSSLNGTGTYPNEVLMRMTGPELVRPNILACGQRTRLSEKARRLMRVARWWPRNLGTTIKPELAT